LEVTFETAGKSNKKPTIWLDLADLEAEVQSPPKKKSRVLLPSESNESISISKGEPRKIIIDSEVPFVKHDSWSKKVRVDDSMIQKAL